LARVLHRSQVSLDDLRQPDTFGTGHLVELFGRYCVDLILAYIEPVVKIECRLAQLRLCLAKPKREART
jgi:hypothetical protein